MQRIMIVDDDKDIVNLIDEALSAMGYQTEKTYSGKECLEKVEKFQPDMILLDIMMPGMDGWKVLEELEKKGITEKTKVVMLTAKTLTPDDTKRKYFGQLVHYLQKPISIDELTEEIANIFQEEKNIQKESKKVSQILGKEFGGSYQELLDNAARRRRIFSTLLSNPIPIEIIENPEGATSLIQSIEKIEKELHRLKGYFNPMVHFFCFGIEKELERMKTFLNYILKEE
ncbi:MAG TPA: response regulator [Thermoplasmata archaeon]|nr:response regulator [Thermoplasmata archaeon]